MSRFVIGVDIDASQANSEIDALQAKVDTTVQKWREQRRDIYMQLSELNRGLGLMIQTVRMAARATGQTIPDYANAAFAMIQSTTSILLATSVAYKATGVLAGAGLALAAFAYGFNTVQSALIIARSEQLQEDFANIVSELGRLQREVQGPLRYTM